MKRILMAAAIATAFTASPTMAAYYGSATLTNFQYEVVDLNETDGIDASFNFFSNNYSELYGRITKSDVITASFNQSSSNNNLTSYVVSDSLSNASASIHYGDNIVVSSQASAGTFGDSSHVQSYVYQSPFFTLGAYSRVVFTADSNLFLGTTSGNNDFLGYSQNGFYAVFFNRLINDWEFINNSEGGRSDQIAINTTEPKILSEFKSLNIIIDNFSSLSSLGYLVTSSETFGGYYPVSVSAVPVPAALPLMASALGLFGLSRRKNKAPTA